MSAGAFDVASALARRVRSLDTTDSVGSRPRDSHISVHASTLSLAVLSERDGAVGTITCGTGSGTALEL